MTVKQILTCAVCLIIISLVGVSCQSETSKISQNQATDLTIAAAANLTDAFAEIGPRFTNQTGIKVVFNFGATADLAKQIENGAPFDVFAAADSEHPQQLETKGLLTTGSRATYARGILVLWVPAGSKLRPTRIEDITAKDYERIAIA